MYIPASIELKNYMPKALEKGMLFVRIQKGLFIEVWELEKVPLEPIEEFISKHGPPVELQIVDESGEVLAIHEEIGWWDDGPDWDEYRDISLKDINGVINTYDGQVDVLAFDDDEYGINLEYYDNKVVICLMGMYEEEEEEPEMCSSCNGIGEEIDESPCTSCNGTGVSNTSEWFKNKFNKDREIDN